MKNENTIQTVVGGQGQLTLLQVYDSDLHRLSLRVGKDRAASTYRRQQQGRRHVADFLTTKLRQPDMALSQLTTQFIYDYASYLSAELQLRPGTVWLFTQMLKCVVGRACQRGQLSHNPFAAAHFSKNIRPRQYLTEQELKQLMDYRPPQPYLRFVRDLFVFAAMTGMSFVDICNLKSTDISDVNGETWILARRHKTMVPFYVHLNQAALDIVRHYDQGADSVFGPINYRRLAAQVPRLMQLCGIKKHITFHCARHTFAVMALNAGVPIESVSRVLGHTNITTTQIYAKITMQKLSRDMTLFDKHLARTYYI